MKKNKEKNDKKDSFFKDTEFNIFEVLFIAIVSIIFGILVTLIVVKDDNDDKYIKNFKQVYNDITTDYYKKVNKKKLTDAAIKGMFEYLGDPYTNYMNEDETEKFNNTVDGYYKGIGVQVSIINKEVTIISVFQNSSASRAGLQAGDIITKVNGKSLDGKKLSEVVSEIKSKNNMILTIKRNNKEEEYHLNLSSVEIPSVSSKTFDKNNKKIGYITISMFSFNTYKQFYNKLNDLENNNIDSLIIDVRDNPGGSLDQVSKILSLFMDKKHVIYQIEYNGKKTKTYSLTNDKRNYPIGVLINKNSASASEILASSLNENLDSIIVGENSYGKGTVQKEYTLSNGSSVKYTSERWLTPKGNSINKKGVKPTNEVILSEYYYKNPSYDSDNQLQTLLELLSKK